MSANAEDAIQKEFDELKKSIYRGSDSQGEIVSSECPAVEQVAIELPNSTSRLIRGYFCWIISSFLLWLTSHHYISVCWHQDEFIENIAIIVIPIIVGYLGYRISNIIYYVIYLMSISAACLFLFSVYYEVMRHLNSGC